MREIKFRAWNVKNRSLFSVFGFNGLYVFADTPNGVGTENNPACTEDCVLEQFTGLHDKNGEEIYEGDVVYNKWNKTKGRVNFMNGSFWVQDGTGFSDNDFCWEDLKVLGNIHENPELLNAR